MRFASVLRFLIVQPFTKGYGPFRFSIMKQDDAKEIYARVTTYFTFICVWACIVVAAFSQEVLQVMAKESYWEATSVIPILLVSNFFGSALYYMFQIGVYLQKSTKVLSKVFAVAAAIDLLLMRLMVPEFGPAGAAFAQLITHAFIALMGLYCSQRIYFIPYEWSRLFKIGLIGGFVGVVTYSNYHFNPYLSVAFKLPVILSFPGVLFVTGFLNQGEMTKLKKIVSSIRKKQFGFESFTSRFGK